MKNYLAAFLMLGSPVSAGEWVVVEGGKSPDKKLAVAVFPHKSTSDIDADGTALLIDQASGKKIGPLEEINSTGGTWGKTTENVRCEWSPDSALLIVNFRTGRMMHSSQIYRIQGQRAHPVELPHDKAHPKARILETLGSSANPGSEVTLAKDGTILKRRWGLVPKNGQFEKDYSIYGLKGFEGSLLFHYRLDEKGQLQIKDVTVPSR